MLDRTNPKPLHQQMEELMRKKLASNEWKPKQAIPSENELTRLYGVSRMTVRSVITRLVLEGLLVRIPGKGTFVSEQKIVTAPLFYAGIREQLEQMGHAIRTEILAIKKIFPNAQTSQHIALPDGEYYMLQRLRSLQEEPLSIHTSYIPVELAPGLENCDLQSEQLCVTLHNQYGLERSRVVETLESVAATKQQASLLGLSTKHPLLRLQDIIFAANDQAFEYSTVIFRGDRIKMRFVFE